MCMLSSQRGLPLDEGVMSTMSSEERIFWEGLMKRGMEEFGEAASAVPITPSAELKTMYEEAIRRNGQIYCPVRQMEEVFDFS